MDRSIPAWPDTAPHRIGDAPLALVQPLLVLVIRCKFALSLQFRKSDVPRDEIVRALQSIIEDLLSEEA